MFVKIAFIPSSPIFYRNKFFDYKSFRDDALEPFFALREWCKNKGIILQTFDMYKNQSDIDAVIVSRFDFNLKPVLQIIRANPSVRIILQITEECNIVPIYIARILKSALFDIVLTWNDNMVDDKYFIKYCYPNPFREMITPVPFAEKKYLCIINSYKINGKDRKSDLYLERIKLIQHFSVGKKIDLFGMGWKKFADPLIQNVYKGSAVSKIETMKHYKFAIAFENSRNEPGDISEKLFDAMAAGCVPVYWGAPNILDYIPKNIFIDYRKFSSYNELDAYLSDITEDEYNAYLNAISKFLKSESYLQFTSYGFVDRVSYALQRLEKQPQRLKSIFEIKLDLAKKVLLNIHLFYSRRRFIYDLITG